jgi:hypothetical protein
MNRSQNQRRGAVIGVSALAGLAAAALAMAPLAAADPTDITSTVDAEIASMNSLFDFETLLTGDSKYVVSATDTQPFDTINPDDVSTVQGDGTTPFDYLVYGLNPTAAGLASDPGAYNVYNGASVEFDDAYNVFLYSLLNGGALDPNADDFFGSQSMIDSALGDDATVMSAFDTFFQAGVADLEAYFGF